MLFTGGEKLGEIYGKFNFQFIDSYGPTEACVYVTSINEEDKIDSSSVGHLLNNLKAYVLDENLNRVPCGAVGELFLAGYQIADGYLNREEETRQSFFEEGRSCAVRLSRNQSLRRERALPPNQRIMTMSDNVNKSGLATAGFVLGVISLLAWLLPIIGVPIAIMAFSFGLKCSETPTIIMSVIGLVIGAINATIGAMMFY